MKQPQIHNLNCRQYVSLEEYKALQVALYESKEDVNLVLDELQDLINSHSKLHQRLKDVTILFDRLRKINLRLSIEIMESYKERNCLLDSALGEEMAEKIRSKHDLLSDEECDSKISGYRELIGDEEN